MKDSFDVTQDIWSLLNVDSIKALLGTTGKIHQSERPPSRTTFTDIVINCLGITNNQIQKGSGNINCYVPSLASGPTKADQFKLKALSRLVIELVDEQNKDTFRTWIEENPILMQDTDLSWFMNVQFEYQSMQTNFKRV